MQRGHLKCRKDTGFECMLKTEFNTLLTRIDQLAKNHLFRVTNAWFGPESRSPSFLLCAVVLVALAISANVYIRHKQFQIWQSADSSSQIFDSPTFSTTDAPYFLTHAVSIQRGDPVVSFNSKRVYPNNLQAASETTDTSSLRDHPLLSVLIAGFAESDEPAGLLTAGNLGLFATSALTALAITVCFGAAGYWAQGAIASLGGGLSAAYLVRSSIGRIDTDQLNLGFMYLMFGLVVFAGRSPSPLRCLGWCMFAGAAANLFMWWYGKPELIVMAAIALAWLISCLHRNVFTLLAGTTMFLALSGIVSFDPFSSPYLKDVFAEAGFIFPNTFETITEIQTVSVAQILVNAAGSIEMGIVCLTGLALFLISNPVIAIAYSPLVAFGLLNFIIGNRAMFYSAPILWFGAAFLMTSMARFVAANLSKAGYMPRLDQAATILATSLAMVVAWVNSPTDYVPRPSFPEPVLEGLASLKSTADPANSAVTTWWDYGYASMFFNDLPTFHDGGSQTTPSTHFVATALLDGDQASSIGNLKFLGTKGYKGIAEQTTVTGLKTQFSQAIKTTSPDLYLVVTGQMAGWMSSISQIANWNIETGKPITPRGNNTGPQVFYEPLNCHLAGYPKRLNCAGVAFDLEKGLINGVTALSAWAHSQDGSLVRRQNFENNGNFALQIVQNGNRINAYFLHRQLFESTFNELYYLGQIDHPSLSLHFDDYPHIRIYKMDGSPSDLSDN